MKVRDVFIFNQYCCKSINLKNSEQIWLGSVAVIHNWGSKLNRNQDNELLIWKYWHLWNQQTFSLIRSELKWNYYIVHSRRQQLIHRISCYTFATKLRQTHCPIVFLTNIILNSAQTLNISKSSVHCVTNTKQNLRQNWDWHGHTVAIMDQMLSLVFIWSIAKKLQKTFSRSSLKGTQKL